MANNNISSDNLINEIKRINYNPNEIVRLFLKAVEEYSNGEVGYFDPSNPVLLAMEAGIITPAAILKEMELVSRRLYKPAVDNWTDLYLHMQDRDFDNITSSPGTTTVNFILSVEEIRLKALPLANNPDIKVINFPKHTQITVGDYTLMFKYPFSIRINKHGNISIKYLINDDGAILGRLAKSTIDYKYINLKGVMALSIPIEVVQVAMHSMTMTVSPTSGFSDRVSIKDKFFKVKAYVKPDVGGPWIEIETTRRMKVLNKDRPTLIIDVDDLNNTVNLRIPSYYFNNGSIRGTVRVDIYTTKGAVEHSLANYNDGSYKLSYKDYDDLSNPHSGLLGALNLLKVTSVDMITGGGDAVDFQTAKDMVINRSTITEGLPITEIEINNKLAKLGFSNVKVKDDLSERIFAASKLLPVPENDLTVTGVGCSVQTIQTTISELQDLATVKTNGQRLTVLPDTLYNVINGILTVVPHEQVLKLKDPSQTPPESLAAWANTNNLVYTPYYYVHDISNNEYNVRAYRLDKPTITEKSTVNDNASLQLDASVSLFDISLLEDGTGYRLYLGLQIGENFKELLAENVSLQLSFANEDGSNRYYLNGELVTGIDPETGHPYDDNYIYQFVLRTNWDIDQDHNLILSQAMIPMPLVGDFDVFVIVKDFEPVGFSKTNMDNIININSLENFDGRSTQYALVQERLSIVLGKYMRNLWQRSRTTISEADYKRYEDNVPALYSDNVYRRDNNGVIEMEYDSVSNMVVPAIIHRKGDQVVDPTSGNPIWKHLAGEIVKELGQPVYKDGLRGLKRQFDLIVLDGLYYLSTHQETIEYVQSVLDVIDLWVFETLESLRPEALQRTDILFHPKSTVGLIEVYAENGIKIQVQSDQDLFVKFFVDRTVYNSPDMRREIETTTKKIIQRVLETRTTISLDDVLSSVRSSLSENVLGVEIHGFLNDQFNTVTLATELTIPTIGKRLGVNSKLEIVVEDSVEFEFILHGKREL